MNRCARTAAFFVCVAIGVAAPALARVADRPFELRPELVEAVNRSMNISRSAVAKLDVPRNAGEAFDLTIPYETTALTLRMVPHSVRSAEYRLVHQIADGSFVDVEPGPVRTYRGTIDELPGALVAGSIDSDGFIGKVFMLHGADNLIIEPLVRRINGAELGDHVIYASGARSSDVVGGCGTGELALRDAIDGPAAPGVARGVAGAITIAELVCDADFEYFLDFGPNTEDRINTIMNTVNIEYERDVNITHEITAVVIRTAEPDPYSSSNSGELVNQVAIEWVFGTHPEITRDVVHLFTGKNIDGSIIGIAATIGGICTVGGVCLSQAEYNGVFDCATALVAHELGHLWGAEHCDCTGNTMHPFNTCENQFAQVTIDSIIAHRDSRTCLSFPEPAFTGFPFFDPFADEALDASFWTGVEGTPTVSGNALNIPSNSFALNLSGTDLVRSAMLPCELQNDLIISYQTQRAGAIDSPEPGDDLFVEYLNEAGDWLLIERILGDGPDQTEFVLSQFMLPDDAEYDGLRIRFRNVSFNDDTDDFFIDDVRVEGTPILPGDFNLGSPADAATDVASSPTFTWDASEFATNYTIQVDGDPAFGSPNLNLTTPVTSFSNPGFQLPDGEYFWRVTANNVNGSIESVQNPSVFTVGPAIVFCPGDCNDNGIVNFDDLVAMLFQFGNDPGNGCDADESGNVDFNDLVAALFVFGPCP